MKKPFFILGASDPEMALIKEMISAAGLEYALAAKDGKEVHPGNAYQADGLLGAQPGPDHQVVVVECQVEGVTPDLVVDHHRPGDPGYGVDAYLYWQASSVGQVWEYLVNGVKPGGERGPNPMGLPPMEAAKLLDADYGILHLAAAADHCLGAAYRGKCPGIDPLALRLWRAMSRAEFQGVTPSEINRKVNAAIRQLLELPEVSIGEEKFRDARDQEIHELPEASAITGEAVWYSLFDKRSERVKEGVLGGTPEQVQAWLGYARENLEQPYGDPARGFAGGYRPAN